MLKVDMPKKYLTDASGCVSCAMCKKYLPLLYRDCHKDSKGCLIKGELVLCGKCYYKDEKRIMDEDALWCRKHHMYVTADWFCADGARKIESGVYVNGEVAFIKGGPEDENESALDETEDVDK